MVTLTSLLGENLLKNDQSIEFDADELEQKTIGLYFA
jgi:hypothetical protein